MLYSCFSGKLVEGNGGKTMTVLTFLGTFDIDDSDNDGIINLKLALDLLHAIRLPSASKITEEKATNIIEVCCESTFIDLIEFYDWNRSEIDYAESIFARCIKVATFELLAIAMKRMTHSKKREGEIKLRIEDLKLAAMMAYLMSVHTLVRDRLEDIFRETHGAMYFST
ncbi:MAG: hypothetical protein ACI92I_000937 [Acidimicrobiales bacterium]